METMQREQPQLQPSVPDSGTDLRGKFISLKDAMKSTFVERDDVVDISVMALLSKQNAFFLGVPGTAKSAIVRYISSSISDARGFDILLGRFTSPEQVFGPLDLKAMDQGLQKTIIDDHLPNAHIGFLDEVWKASNAILNSLLTIINERKFHDGGKVVDCPLISTFSASNELPQSEDELAAIYDRFLLKSVVHPVSSATTLKDLLGGGKATVPPSISINEVQKAHEEIKNVSIPKGVLEDVSKIVFKIRKEGIIISDRTVISACSDVNPLTGNKALSIIKVPAWLDGRDKVIEEDLIVLKHVFWSDPKDIKIVSKIIYEVANPYEQKAQEAKDTLRDILDTFNSEYDDSLGDNSTKVNTAAGIKANEEIKKLARQLDKIRMKSGNESNPKLKPIIEAYEAVTIASKAVAQRLLNIDDVPLSDMKRPAPRLD